MSIEGLKPSISQRPYTNSGIAKAFRMCFSMTSLNVQNLNFWEPVNYKGSASSKRLILEQLRSDLSTKQCQWKVITTCFFNLLLSFYRETDGPSFNSMACTCVLYTRVGSILCKSTEGFMSQLALTHLYCL